jgi:lipopolysaccharide biosynthesis glycosyltransferase
MNRAIVTSFDANYFQYSMVLVKTFADNYNGPDLLDFICLVPLDLIDREREYIETVNVSNKLRIQFRSSQKFEELVSTERYNFDKLDYITSNAMQRIFLASTLHEYDEVIYLDPDTMVLRDVQPLLSYPLFNKIAAMPEPRNPSRQFGGPDVPYFNNGVFITTLEYWRAQALETKMVEWLLATEDLPNCIEQDAMNQVLKTAWAPLSPTCNFWATFATYGLYTEADPLIVHFIGRYKPWINYSDITDLETAWRKFYLELFPDATFHEQSGN